MTNETYLNHPTFGLLFSLCAIEDNRELFTTLYAHRLFFIVIAGPQGMEFETITRAEARLIVENRLRSLRRLGQQSAYDLLQVIHRRTFM